MCTINQDHMMNGSGDMKFNRQNFFVILGSILPFYPPSTLKKWKYQKWKKPWRYDHFTQVYCSWDMVCERCNCYFSFWAIFLPFNPPNSPKNENFKTMKKHLYISFYISTKNYDQMLYCYWDMVRDRCNYFSFWTIFCPFTQLSIWKCGLGILDIDTQLNSLKLQWI